MTESRGLERVTVNFLPKTSDALGRSVDRTRLSKTNTINRAVQMYDYLESLTVEGAEILVRQPGSDELMLLRWF